MSVAVKSVSQLHVSKKVINTTVLYCSSHRAECCTRYGSNKFAPGKVDYAYGHADRVTSFLIDPIRGYLDIMHQVVCG